MKSFAVLTTMMLILVEFAVSAQANSCIYGCDAAWQACISSCGPNMDSCILCTTLVDECRDSCQGKRESIQRVRDFEPWNRARKAWENDDDESVKDEEARLG